MLLCIYYLDTLVMFGLGILFRVSGYATRRGGALGAGHADRLISFLRKSGGEDIFSYSVSLESRSSIRVCDAGETRVCGH